MPICTAGWRRELPSALAAPVHLATPSFQHLPVYHPHIPSCQTLLIMSKPGRITRPSHVRSVLLRRAALCCAGVQSAAKCCASGAVGRTLPLLWPSNAACHFSR